MTNKDDDELAKALSDILVPWDWHDVVLQFYDDAHIEWCRNLGLIFGKDFYMHVDEPNVDITKGKWPFPTYLHNHHYLFKDPVNATAFTLTFLT